MPRWDSEPTHPSRDKEARSKIPRSSPRGDGQNLRPLDTSVERKSNRIVIRTEGSFLGHGLPDPRPRNIRDRGSTERREQRIDQTRIDLPFRSAWLSLRPRLARVGTLARRTLLHRNDSRYRGAFDGQPQPKNRFTDRPSIGKSRRNAVEPSINDRDATRKNTGRTNKTSASHREQRARRKDKRSFAKLVKHTRAFLRL